MLVKFLIEKSQAKVDYPVVLEKAPLVGAKNLLKADFHYLEVTLQAHSVGLARKTCFRSLLCPLSPKIDL